MTSPNQLTSTIHQATVRLYENNGCVLKRESACLDLTDFLCVAKSCVALEVLVFQLTLKSDDETAVHLFDGATSVCPCRRSKENGAENASFSYPLPSDKKIVNTFIHATSTANSVGVTMSQADLAYSYNVLVDLGRRLFPRFYDMSEFNFALNRPKEFVVNKMAEHYLPCPSHLPLASREEFIMLTQSDSLKDYIFLEDWIEQEEKRVEGIAWFYSKKAPDDLLLRRYFVHLVINFSCDFSFFLIIFCHPGFCLANVTDMKKCVFFAGFAMSSPISTKLAGTSSFRSSCVESATKSSQSTGFCLTAAEQSRLRKSPSSFHPKIARCSGARHSRKNGWSAVWLPESSSRRFSRLTALTGFSSSAASGRPAI